MDIQLYRTRWFILAVVCIINFSNNMVLSKIKFKLLFLGLDYIFTNLILYGSFLFEFIGSGFIQRYIYDMRSNGTCGYLVNRKIKWSTNGGNFIKILFL